MYKFLASASLRSSNQLLLWQHHPRSSFLAKAASAAGGLVAATGAAAWIRSDASSPRYASLESKKKDTKNKEDGKDKQSCSAQFDLTKEWEQATTQGRDYFSKWIVTNNVEEKGTSEEKDEANEGESSWISRPNVKLTDFLDDLFAKKNETANTSSSQESQVADSQEAEASTQQVSLTSILGNISKLVIGGGNEESDANALQDLVEEARKSSGRGDVRDSTSFSEIMTIMEQHYQHLDRTLEDTFGHLDLSKLFPTSFYYYLELEDEIKNPSWKRRAHRFHPGVDIEQVKDLMSALYLAELSYKSSVEEIQEGLANARHPVELVYCDTESEPNQPAHYIVLKKEQNTWSNALEVIMVVRGTQSVADALTDAFMETEEYRGGKAHKGILESGRHLVGLHTELLQKLCKLANKRKVKLTLVGHSLGAAAAAIAGIEFNDNPMIEAEVIGFGCPSLLSEQLAEDTKGFVTTVIADADMIPRMNGATIANKLLDIMEHDWIPMAHRDVLQALEHLQHVAPGLVTESAAKFLMTTVDSWLESNVRPVAISQPTQERADCILYPPGTCIHFYRDGSGITGSKPPCTFFNDIDVARTMVDDHLIDKGYRRIFLEVMRQYKRNHHFAFEEDKYWK